MTREAHSGTSCCLGPRLAVKPGSVSGRVRLPADNTAAAVGHFTGSGE